MEQYSKHLYGFKLQACISGIESCEMKPKTTIIDACVTFDTMKPSLITYVLVTSEVSCTLGKFHRLMFLMDVH